MEQIKIYGYGGEGAIIFETTVKIESNSKLDKKDINEIKHALMDDLRQSYKNLSFISPIPPFNKNTGDIY